MSLDSPLDQELLNPATFPKALQNLVNVAMSRSLVFTDTSRFLAFRLPADFFTDSMEETLLDLVKVIPVCLFWSLGDHTLVVCSKADKPTRAEVHQALKAMEHRDDLHDLLDALYEKIRSNEIKQVRDWDEKCRTEIIAYLQGGSQSKLFSKKSLARLSQKLFLLEEKHQLLFFRAQITKMTYKRAVGREFRVLVTHIPTKKGHFFIHPVEKDTSLAYKGHFLMRLQQRLWPNMTDEKKLHYRFLAELTADKQNTIFIDGHGVVTYFVPGGVCLGQVEALSERSGIIYLLTFVPTELLTAEQLARRSHPDTVPFVINHWCRAE